MMDILQSKGKNQDKRNVGSQADVFMKHSFVSLDNADNILLAHLVD